MTTEVELTIKPCPWCRKTPSLNAPVCYEKKAHEEYPQTWTWKIECINSDCLIKPFTPHVSVRKSSQYTLHRILIKLNELVRRWNANNPIIAYEKLLVKLNKLHIQKP